jgi:hypothetical protein
MFCAPVFMFCAPKLVFSGTEVIGSIFNVLRSRTRFRWYQGRRFPFSCFALSDSFSAVPLPSGPVFMFCAPGLVFGGTEVGVPFSCFPLPDLFSAVSRASGHVFMSCASEIVFSGTVGVGSLFQVLRFRTHFQRYRWRPIAFSCFPLPDMFLAVSRVSGPVFMFCAPRHVFGGTEVIGSILMFCVPGLIFGGTKGVGSRFHVLRSRSRFRRYRGRRVPFSCFALPDSFSAIQRASGLIFIFSLPDSFLAEPSVSYPVFMFSAPGHVFGGTEGVRSRFHGLRSWTPFRRCRVRRVSDSCFGRPNSFSAIPRASGPVFKFCTPGFVFGGTEGVESLFHVLRSRTPFRRYRGSWDHFSCFALPESFSAVPRASGPFFMFSAARLIFGVIEGVGYRFHVLRSRTCFQRYRGRRVPF